MRNGTRSFDSGHNPDIGFDITVLGSSGGPFDGKTCSYLVKTSDIAYEDIVTSELLGSVICVDAGCGLSGINDIILQENKYLFDQLSPWLEEKFRKILKPRAKRFNSGIDTMLSNCYNHNKFLRSYRDSLSFTGYTNCKIKLLNLDCEKLAMSASQLTAKLFANIKDYFVTHPHLDHIAGLVVNSAGFTSSHPKNIFGSQFTIESLKAHVFNGVIWPNLNCPSNGGVVNFIQLNPEVLSEHNSYFHIQTFQVSHGVVSDGHHQQANSQPYQSSTFLIKSVKHQKYLLVFGDLETSNSNKLIWDAVSQLISLQQLSGIIIECSTENVPVNTPLFGHLTPNHLFNELIYLSNKVKSIHSRPGPPLQGLTILVSHVKEQLGKGNDPRRVILTQLQELNSKHNLGCTFTIALPGITYSL